MASIKTIIEIRNKYMKKESPKVPYEEKENDKKVENENTYPFLNIDCHSKGICLSEVQMDLISLTEISSLEELIQYINECRQIDYTEPDLEYIKGLDLESAKRQVFKDYQDTLLGTHEYAKDKMSFIRKKIENLGISGATVNETANLFSQGNSAEALKIIIERENISASKIKEKFFSQTVLDKDDVKTSSYEEILNLGKRLEEFDSVTMSGGNYDIIMNGKDFDPYHIKRQLEFCKKHNMQANYDGILTKDTIKKFNGYDPRTTGTSLIEYLKQTLDYLNTYNRKNKINKDGSKLPVIQSIYVVDDFSSLLTEDFSLEDLAELCKYAKSNKKSGMSFVYNAGVLEEPKSRKSKVENIAKLNELCPGLIDTCGISLHATPETTPKTIEDILRDLKELNDQTGIRLSIVDFDTSLFPQTIIEMKHEGYKENEIRSYAKDSKKEQLEEISKLARSVGLKFDSVTYSTATDSMDRKKVAINEARIKSGLAPLETVYGGTFDNSLEVLKKPKHKEEIQNFGQTSPIIREDSSFKVPENDGIIEASGENISTELDTMMNERSPLVVEKQYEKSEGKIYKKTPRPVNTNNTSANGGFANSPQLLIVIILSLLAIIGMILS